MSAPRRRPRARGAAMIEFVLVAPLFLMLMLGAIDWGWYFVLRETVVNATREGARAASVQEIPDTQSVAAATTAVEGYLARVGATAVPVQAPDVELIFITVPGVLNPVRAARVRLTNYPSRAISGVSFTLVPTTMNVETVMRLEIQE